MTYKVIEEIQSRLHKQNKNYLACFVGATGSGKSYSALKVASLIQPDFDVETQCVFNPKDFMNLLNSGKLKRGDVIIYDESGVGMASRNFMSMSNKLFSFVLQTFRHQNICVIFTLPTLSMLDLQARNLLHAIWECKGVNRKEAYCMVKLKNLQTNALTGKVYKKLPRIINEDGTVTVVSYLKIHKPGRTVLAHYEEKKQEFTHKLNLSIERDMEKISKKGEVRETSEQLAEKYLKAKYPINYDEKGKAKVDEDMVAIKMKVGCRVALRVRKLVEYMLNNPEVQEHEIKSTESSIGQSQQQ